MSATRKQLADEIDRLDAEIVKLQDEKKTFIAAYREAFGRKEAKAAKAAIRERQKINADKTGPDYREHRDLVEEVLEEITAASRARSAPRTREAKPEVSAALIETVAAGLQTEIGRKALVTAIDIMIDREEAVDPETGEIVETNSPATAPRRVDDLGSVQDARKMSTDGQPVDGLNTSGAERLASRGVTLAASEQAAAFASIAIPDDQLVSVRYPEGVRKVPYAEFKRGVEAAQSGAA